VESFDIPASGTPELRPGVGGVKGHAQPGPCERHKSFHDSPIQRVIHTGKSGERMPVHVIDGHTDGGDGVLYPVSAGCYPTEADHTATMVATTPWRTRTERDQLSEIMVEYAGLMKEQGIQVTRNSRRHCRRVRPLTGK
jgi:hypothetical protein